MKPNLLLGVNTLLLVLILTAIGIRSSVNSPTSAAPILAQAGQCYSFSTEHFGCYRSGETISCGSGTSNDYIDGAGLSRQEIQTVNCSGEQNCSISVPVALPNPLCCDQDHDLYNRASCGGSDCRDDDYYINPGATEVCEDGIDNDCQNGDACCDDDSDGVCNANDCSPNNSNYSYDNDHDGYCEDVDCDDYNPSVHPGATITNCNSAGDVNCNGHEDALDCIGSPVVVDVAGDGINLTDSVGGVNFDLDSDGRADKISWTRAGTDDAWLMLDRNGNGAVDNGTELFGNFTPQPTPPAGVEKNGFLALAEYDKPQQGGNGDRQITRNDTIFAALRLWQDANHNGLSEPGELQSLRDLGLKSIDLDYKESKRTDRYGNQFRYRAKVKDTHDAQLGRWAWDVFLQIAPGQSAQNQTPKGFSSHFASDRFNNLFWSHLKPFITSSCQLKTETITTGSKVQISDVNWQLNKQTLLLVLRNGCHFCSDSAAFYQRLAAERGIKTHAKLVAVLPGTGNDSRKYLDHLGVPIEEVRQAGLGALGVAGTPTLLLVNDKGVVTHSWRGQLPPQQEEEVINVLRGEDR